MRLQDGLIIDNEKTFGVLKFSAMHREKMRQNEDGTVSDELLERVYDLKYDSGWYSGRSGGKRVCA